MANMKNTTLPNILSEYSKTYKDHQRSSRPRKSQRESRVSAETRASPEPAVHEESSPLIRESSFLSRQKQDKQRRERVYEFWQSLQEDLRDQESDRLQERVTLQQELIRAQDERYQRRQEQERRRYYKKRNEEKAKRDAKAEELQEICRQSLSEDRRLAAERKKAFKSQTGVDPVATAAALTASSVSQATAPDPTTPPGTGSHLSLASGPLLAPSTGDGRQHDTSGVDVFATLQEEQEEDGEEEEEKDEGEVYLSEGDEELLPWHHVQLYRLYGRHADYFLHPKIETKQKAPVQLNPKLRAIGGHAGAGVLWKALRNESRLRLVRQDTKLLSSELKSAFGAFTREGLLKKRQPVKRNYNSGEDVPELARLMDQSKVHTAQDFRHKVELMFRSSQINQDRTHVLLHNNPAPNLNDQRGEESIQRYLPSWADTEAWDQESELSYKKWLKRAPTTPPLAIERAPEDPGASGDHGNETKPVPAASPSVSAADSPKVAAVSASGDWDAILSARQHKKQNDAKPTPKYVFLTEADATVPGEFSAHWKELADNKGIPRAHERGGESPVVVSPTAGEPLDRDTTARSSSTTSQLTDKKSYRASTAEVPGKFCSTWQPLSLGALGEYRTKPEVLGQGSFRQGTVPVWSTARV